MFETVVAGTVVSEASVLLQHQAHVAVVLHLQDIYLLHTGLSLQMRESNL